MVEKLQLLLGVKFHNVLLRIVFELILALIESSPAVIQHFRNNFIMDILLKIFEDYEDRNLKIHAIDTLDQLVKADQFLGSQEVLLLFRRMDGPAKLLASFQNIDDTQRSMSTLVCLQSLTTSDQDILQELKQLNIVDVMLDLI